MDSKSSETIDGIKIRRYSPIIEGNSIIGYMLEYLVSLWKITFWSVWIALKYRIQVIHICNPPDLLFIPAQLIKFITNSMIVYDQHDLNPEVILSKGYEKDSIFYKLFLMFEKITYHCADAVIATNESYKSIAMTRGNKEFSDVFIVRSGPKKNFGTNQDKFIRDSTSSRNLLFLGTMGPQEGVDILIRMIAELRSWHLMSNIILNLVGSGPEYPRIKQLISELKLENNVIMHGRVSDDDLKELFSKADIALNSDRPCILNDLSTMNKVIEYMAFGLPIIQFDFKEARFTAGDASIYIAEYTASAFATEVYKLIHNKDKRIEMSRFGLKRFHQCLTWESQEIILLTLYEKILGGY